MPSFDRAKTLQAAEKFVKAGKLIEAVNEYKKLADDNPRDMNVINKLGDLLVRAGRVPDALKHFLRIADFYAKEGFLLKAIAMYKKICKSDPSNLECQARLALLYQKQGLTTEARTQLLQLAEQQMRQSLGAEAAETLGKVLEIEPENIKVRLTLAELLARSSKPEEAAREYCIVARAAAARGAIEETIQIVRKAIKISPPGPEMASILLSVVCRIEAVPADLVAATREIARQAGRSSLAMVLQAEAMRRAGQRDEAHAAYRRLSEATDLDDDLTAEALILVGRFHAGGDGSAAGWEALDRVKGRLVKEARSAEAAAILDEYLKQQPSHRQALGARAEIAAASGDADGEAALLLRLAKVLLSGRDLARAGEVAARLDALRPGDPAVLDLHEQLTNLDAAAADAMPESGATGSAPEVAVEAEPPAAIKTPVVAPASTGPVMSAEDEAASAEEIFSLDEDSLVIEEDAPAASPAMELEAGTEEESAYGPVSRIQEIQAAGPRGEPIDEEFVSEHLTEADVFVKYGLQEKAREQLNAVLERYPEHEPARQRLKEIFVNEGNTEDAVRECLALAQIRRGQGREAEVREILNEALRIDPESPLLAEVRQMSPNEAPTAAAPAHPGPVGRSASAVAPARIDNLEASEVTFEPSAATAAVGEESIEIDGDLEIELDLPETDFGGPLSEAAAPAMPQAMADTPAGDFAATTARTVLPVVPERVQEESPEDFLSRAGKSEPGSDDLIGDLADAAAADPGAADPVVVDEGTEPVIRAPRPVGEPDEEKLGEVDFYVEQGLIDEARQVLFQLGKQYPASAAVKTRLAQLDSPRNSTARTVNEPAPQNVDFEVEQALTGKAPRIDPPPAPPRASRPRPVFKVEKTAAAEGGEFFDLAAALDESLAEEQEHDEARQQEALEGQAHSFEDIFAAFKKGVAQQVDSDDFDTHYNLGIAYKEMGLVDEAIGELQFAAQDPSRTLECCGILGLCFRDKGMPELALKWYRRGLDHPGLDERQTLGLRYDIAEVFREKGDYNEALRMYTEVYGIDSTYREVSSRIKEVRTLLAPQGR